MARQVSFRVKREGHTYFAVLIFGFSRQEFTSMPLASKGDAFAMCEMLWSNLRDPPEGPVGYAPDSLLPD